MRSTEAALCAALLALAACAGACTIERTYLGSEILADPYEAVLVGSSTKPQVLATFGPPDRIVRQRDGDVFVYRYAQRNGFQLEIEEPFSGIEIFTWDRVQEKSDRLLVFFDRNGRVSAFGFRRGRDELQPL
jgi:outer membrane protein assembly factor BamE (lipoprotein component of BamABCDE complex)